MAIVEINSGPLTHKKLMRKSKSELINCELHCCRHRGWSTYISKMNKEQLCDSILDHRRHFLRGLEIIDLVY